MPTKGSITTESRTQAVELTSVIRHQAVQPMRRRIATVRECTLTPEDRQAIKAIKHRLANRDIWDTMDHRNLEGALAELNLNEAADLPVALRKRFEGKTLDVLYEGCGFSTAPEELAALCRELGIQVKVTRTDLYTPEQFAEVVHQKQMPIELDNYVQATPEELREKLGEGRFHLILSVFGGMMYTPLPKIKGLYSLCSSLAPGGVAYISTINRPKDSAEIGGSALLPTAPSESMFFERNKDVLAVEDGMGLTYVNDDFDEDYTGTVVIVRELNGKFANDLPHMILSGDLRRLVSPVWPQFP